MFNSKEKDPEASNYIEILDKMLQLEKGKKK